MEGGGYAHGGRYLPCGAGGGWTEGVGGLVSSIHPFTLPAAPVKDYYPRCISTTTLINPISLFPTSLVCLTLSCTLCYCAGRHAALLVLFIGAAFFSVLSGKWHVTLSILSQIAFCI